jgi:hypothetical protein
VARSVLSASSSISAVPIKSSSEHLDALLLSGQLLRTVTRTALALADSQMLRDRRGACMTRDETRARVRADYLELPGLKLTAVQAARLWAIDQAIAVDVLDELVASGFLCYSGGQYARPIITASETASAPAQNRRPASR